MRSRTTLFVIAVLAATLAVPAAAQAVVRAGVGKVDASWHVGASAGQYASDCQNTDEPPNPDDCTFANAHGVDPHHHSTRRARSYGIQSRLTIRAIVVEGNNGGRVALVKNDLYIPQDLLYRRTAQILEAGNSGINRRNLTMAVSHNHSSPYYSGTSWGVWAFQDVFDFRFFEYYAQRMAQAVEEAAGDLERVKVGASVRHFDPVHRNVPGPNIADDGTPAGFPNDYTDHDLTVIRFDRPNGSTLANIVSYSLHPEFLSGNNLISADYLGPLERMVDRKTGGLTIFTQSAVGTSEPERASWHPPSSRLYFEHREYAQGEFGARLIADAVIGTWRDIEQGAPADPGQFAPFSDDFEVNMSDLWFPGPASHPYPGVSSCRTDAALQGDPRAPIVGMPDCTGRPKHDEFESQWREHNPGVTTDDIQRHRIPVPENYSAPSYTGLEEDVSVHLQAFELGDILVTVCSCEQWVEQSKNIKTRTNAARGDDYHGYDWTAQCTQTGGPGSDWSCPRPGGGSRLTISDASYRKVHAQVNNDAVGWDRLEYVAHAESEPTNPDEIKGNFSHTEIDDYGGQPYSVTVPISMANDYNGYIVSYREYQRGDHYRKALTAWGPHSSDYMATRLVRMAAGLNRGAGPGSSELPEGDDGPILPTRVADAVDEWPGGAAKVQADLNFNEGRAAAIGGFAAGAIAAYEAQLPNDGGRAEAEKQPNDVERFGASLFTWNGGSNYTDNPEVRVQRRVGGEWENYANQTGEVPVTLKYPAGGETVSYRTGSYRWLWTAHFEAFVAPFDTGERGDNTPPGIYRFVAEGKRREGGKVVDYTVRSNEFGVGPWTGVTVNDLRADPDGTVSFASGPRNTYDVPGEPPMRDEIGPIDYPDSYKSPAPFIAHKRTSVRDPAEPANPDKVEWFCFTCSWRPWIDAAEAERAIVTFIRRNGSTVRSPATLVDGRWVAGRKLGAGEAAYVESGDVCDRWGNYNGGSVRQIGDTDLEADNPPVGYSCLPLAGAGGPGGPGDGRGGGASAGNPLGLLPSGSCVDRRKWRFRIHQPKRGRIKAVTVYVNGKRVLKRVKQRGAIRRLTLRRLPKGRFRVKIVAIHSSGKKTVSKRWYRGCSKTRPITKVKRKKKRNRRR
jgi:hypothetical protein